MLSANSLKILPKYLCPTLLKSSGVVLSSRRVCPLLFQSASISSKHFRDRSVKKPAPWPYKEKRFTSFHQLFRLDKTLSRFDENTQLIVVEGNIGSGKTEFAQKLAEELEMHYFPEPNVESLYFTDYGFDLRSLDDIVPPSYKSYVLKDFYENPHKPHLYRFQTLMYYLRLEQYMEALAHILNTGQGVVLERCVLSDYIFVEAMRKMGYFTPGMYKLAMDTRSQGNWHLDLKPTVVIYLDVEVNNLMDRIKKRNIDYEVNSKVLTKDYLSTLEHYYKQDYLKYISKFSELVIYDWNQYGDIEEVAHDIEKIDFSQYDDYDFKLKAWKEDSEDVWSQNRILYSSCREIELNKAHVPRMDVPEINFPPEESQLMGDIISKLPDFKYEKGFNPHMGKEGLKKRTYWEKQKFTLYSDMYTLVTWS